MDTQGASSPSPDHLLRTGKFQKQFAEPMQEVNQRCIELLVAEARRETGNDHGPHLLNVLHGRLGALNRQSILRLSTYPLALVDFGFHDREWWRESSAHPTRAARARHQHQYFPKAAAIRLARTTLMLAWHAISIDEGHAMIALGMEPEVISIIGKIRFHSIDQIAEHHFQRLMPRWEDRPSIWTRLLDDSINSNQIIHSGCNLYSLQLLAGEFLACRNDIARGSSPPTAR